MQWIKSLVGHSGCSIDLYCKDSMYYVVKQGKNNLAKSAHILNDFKELGFYTPDIKVIKDDKIIMEYINGVDMRTYIYNADNKQISKLVNFINTYIERSKDFETIDISNKVLNKIKEIEGKVNTSDLTFDLFKLYEYLPTIGKCGLIHGDLTLDNILYFNDKFYLIDSNPTDINSIEYDTNKILQDLDCLWFVRDEKDKIGYKITCEKISQQLKNKWDFLNNKYILIFMLLRVLPYCKNEKTKTFITKEVNNLWQS